MGERFMIFQEMLDDERKEGRQEGKQEGKIEDIKAILESKGIILKDDFYLKVLKEQNASQLLRILIKASSVQNIDEFLGFLKAEQIMII